MRSTHTIRGYTIVLPYVRNVYPIEKIETGFAWGFKYTDGFYETFDYKTRVQAHNGREAFVKAVEQYWENTVQ